MTQAGMKIQHKVSSFDQQVLKNFKLKMLVLYREL